MNGCERRGGHAGYERGGFKHCEGQVNLAEARGGFVPEAMRMCASSRPSTAGDG